MKPKIYSLSMVVFIGLQFVLPNAAISDAIDDLRQQVLQSGGQRFDCAMEKQCEGTNCTSSNQTAEVLLTSHQAGETTYSLISGAWIGSEANSDFTGTEIGSTATFILPGFGETVELASLDLNTGSITLSQHGTAAFSQSVHFGTCEEKG